MLSKTRSYRQRRGVKPTSVLYLGMATDIMAPLLLVPDVDTIYVINLLDKAYGDTWEEQKNHITTILEQGNDKDVAPSCYLKASSKPSGEPVKKIHTLAGPSTIISSINNAADKKWELVFLYDGKERKLIYYYNRNFKDEWPSDINKIDHMIWNGAYQWTLIMEDDEYGEIVRRMMKERTSSGAYLYALSFNHKGFPEHVIIYDGHFRDGTSVGKMRLDFTDKNWWKKDYTNA